MHNNAYQRLRKAILAFAIAVLLGSIPALGEFLAGMRWSRVGAWDTHPIVSLLLLFSSVAALIISLILAHHGKGPGKWSLRLGSILVFAVDLVGLTGMILDIPGMSQGHCGLFENGAGPFTGAFSGSSFYAPAGFLEFSTIIIGGAMIALIWIARWSRNLRWKTAFSGQRFNGSFIALNVAVILDVIGAVLIYMPPTEARFGPWMADRAAQVILFSASFLAAVVSLILAHWAEGLGKRILQVGSSLLLGTSLLGFAWFFA